MFERACHVDLETIWLMRKLNPSIKTIAEFRLRNPKAFKAVFRKLVILCRGMGQLLTKTTVFRSQLASAPELRGNRSVHLGKMLVLPTLKATAMYIQILGNLVCRSAVQNHLDRPSFKVLVVLVRRRVIVT